MKCNFVNRNNTNCLKTTDSTVDPTDLQPFMETEIGQMYDINDQCKLNYGYQSFACLVC